jgi:AcrR family transcriptional regulator
MPSRRRPPTAAARGRPRQFDPEAALVAAMRVFWKNGYSGASIYAAFGNKEALFRQVLDRYEREKAAYMMDALQQPTARGVAEQLLRGTLALQADDDHPRGSMSIVHSVSSAPGDESVRQYVLERGAYWRQRLIERIERARAEGDFGPGLDARSLALSLKATTDGLLIAAGTGTSDAELEGVVRTFLELWPGR